MGDFSNSILTTASKVHSQRFCLTVFGEKLFCWFNIIEDSENHVTIPTVWTSHQWLNRPNTEWKVNYKSPYRKHKLSILLYVTQPSLLRVCWQKTTSALEFVPTWEVLTGVRCTLNLLMIFIMFCFQRPH